MIPVAGGSSVSPAVISSLMRIPGLRASVSSLVLFRRFFHCFLPYRSLLLSFCRLFCTHRFFLLRRCRLFYRLCLLYFRSLGRPDGALAGLPLFTCMGFPCMGARPPCWGLPPWGVRPPLFSALFPAFCVFWGAEHMHDIFLLRSFRRFFLGRSFFFCRSFSHTRV